MALSRSAPPPAASASFGQPVPVGGRQPGLAAPFGPQRHTLSPEAVIEEELRRQCEELEQKLRQDELSFQNETLAIQLVQMQDDFESLRKDFTSMCSFLRNQLQEKKDQLEEQTRAAGSAEGHADCLHDLLDFHEENGQLIGSYWRAQCEKRDDSIRFLTLKLQEYTVPSAEYQARRQAADDTSLPATDDWVSASSSATSSTAPVDALTAGSVVTTATPVSDTEPMPSIGQSYQMLLDQHLELCREHQEQEDENGILRLELEVSELSQAGLTGKRRHTCSQQKSQEPNRPDDRRGMAALEASMEAECARLRSEVEACEQAVSGASTRAAGSPSGQGRLPSWAHRCLWRDELDVLAGQLEWISLQLDATKRSLDAANEELQWQATSAEALRMRLADVLQAIQSEEVRTSELREEHWQGQNKVEELLGLWPQRDVVGQVEGGTSPALPLVCHQAYWLLETIRHREWPNPPAHATPHSSPALQAESSSAQKMAGVPEVVLEASSDGVRVTL